MPMFSTNVTAHAQAGAQKRFWTWRACKLHHAMSHICSCRTACTAWGDSGQECTAYSLVWRLAAAPMQLCSQRCRAWQTFHRFPRGTLLQMWPFFVQLWISGLFPPVHAYSENCRMSIFVRVAADGPWVPGSHAVGIAPVARNVDVILRAHHMFAQKTLTSNM